MKNQFNKYRYLGLVTPEVPEPWNPLILDMLKTIDKTVKPKLYPRFVLNFMNDISCINGNDITNKFVHKKLMSLISNVYISQIKQKFGILRVYGTFTTKVQEIISATELLCSNSCEFCGKTGTSHTMVKSWVRNLCPECKENTKKNGVNNGSSTSN